MRLAYFGAQQLTTFSRNIRCKGAEFLKTRLAFSGALRCYKIELVCLSLFCYPTLSWSSCLSLWSFSSLYSPIFSSLISSLFWRSYSQFHFFNFPHRSSSLAFSVFAFSISLPFLWTRPQSSSSLLVLEKPSQKDLLRKLLRGSSHMCTVLVDDQRRP